ncbi:MAG: carbon dioxide concentrating mechanism protein [Cyanobacteria bacterium P01_G01_bin.39]
MIYLPPPQPILNKEIRISGDVEIHPTASLAPGVILQAAPDSRIVVGADVCIGMGVIINACQGDVEIGDGAILGTGVLVIGHSEIGNNSCIGTSTTIFRENIAAMAVIEPGSIIGDASRPAPKQAEQVNHQDSDSPRSTSFNKSKINSNGNGFVHNPEPPKETKPKQTKSKVTPQNNSFVNNSGATPQIKTVVEQPITKPKTPVVGQVYINELLITLFPHKKQSDSG